MRLGQFQRRHAWGILGSALVIAAFLVLAAASFHVKGLPSKPWACDEFVCADPIYDLRAPYASIAKGALVAGTTGMLLLIPARPLRWSRYSGRPHGWSRVLWNMVLFIGLAIGVLLPWWALMDGAVRWSVPTVSLTIVLGLTWVHITMWWWLRRQHGRDRGAWLGALTVQAIATILTVAIAAPFFLLAAVIAPPLQLILLLVGAKIAAKPPEDETEQHPVERDTAASTSLKLLTTAGVVAIIVSAGWASVARPIPDELQPRLAAGDWPIPREPSLPPTEPAEPSNPVPSRTPASEPTRHAEACTASALDVTVDGWDAATGSRMAALVLTNEHGAQACQLKGLPEFRILQTGEDMEVVVNEYGMSSRSETSYENITIGPGESVEAILHWRGKRSASHDASAQRAEINIDGTWIDAEFEFQHNNMSSDSPFDLIKHSELSISKWVPSSNLPR